MKILIFSNYPSNYKSYDRNLRSKIHNEIKKGLDVKHYLYVYRGQRTKQSVDWTEIEMPFYWSGYFNKIAGVFFIIYNNIKLIKNNLTDLIIIEMGNGLHDFPMFFYPLIFPGRNFYVETTTPAVNKSKIVRIIRNKLLTLTLKPYKNIGCGNPSVAEKLKIPPKKVYLSQIGFPEYTFTIKDFQNLSLVYLGTINNRDIWKTIIGLKIFMLKYPNVKITYDIIGGGNKNAVSFLRETIQKESLSEIVYYHDFQPTEFVDKIFKKCNVGVAFVPITEYYDKVSTTKAIEYLLAGMPIIATRTTFATGILKNETGVLCDDTPEDFARALEEIYLNREKFNSEKIREMYKNYAMSYVIKNSHIPMLKSLV